MKISSDTAQKIVSQISEVLEQKINIIDTDGVIIASSNRDRVGSIHGGALRIINENLEQLTVENNLQYEGSQNGVNLPIMIQGEIVGIIGITGKVEDVLKYGQVIKKMTEILLIEEHLREQEIVEQKVRDRFFEEWLISGYERKDADEFKQMAEALNVDITAPKRIVVLQMQFKHRTEDRIQTEISGLIRRHVKEYWGGNVFRTATKMVLVLEDVNEQKMKSDILTLQAQVSRLYNCHIIAGTDSEASRLHLSNSYKRAVKALEMADKHHIAYMCYDELDIDFVLGEVKPEICEQYIRKLFRNNDENEVMKYLEFARTYLETNGSQKEMSIILYQHPNTIKYRIRKLTEVTGVDIRTTRGIYIFSMALKLWDNLIES